MGLRQLLINAITGANSSNKPKGQPGTLDLSPIDYIGATPVKTVEVGSYGTEIYAGYIDEEQIAKLRGREWADIVDQMRRSDPNIKMITSALKSPLKSANWFIQTKEKSEKAELQKRLLEKVLFEDINTTFTKLIGEILTCVDYGYSVFELTYKVKLDDPELGTYNTLKSIAYRSQRTIERWNVNQDGSLRSITQIAYGDLGVLCDMDATFILHFAPDMEGADYEGISTLRPCYGNYFRKNVFLKLLAAGLEKYAIPTPVLKVPAGSEGKAEYTAAVKALKCYTSSQANYLIIPAGWEIEFNNPTFDSEKVRETINFENKEMVNSILASFLLLGQDGAGSFALSKDLSDFFEQTITYLADHVAEQFYLKVFKPIIAMNMGDVPILVELRCDSLEDKADQAWATMIGTLVDKQLIKPDSELEKYVREKYKLPEAAPDPEQEEVDEADPIDPEDPDSEDEGGDSDDAEKNKKVALSEKKKSKAEPAIIRDTAQALRELGQGFLPYFAKKYAKNILRVSASMNDSSKIKAPLDANVPSITAYKNAVKAYYAHASIVANDIQKEKFRKSKMKLAEFRLNDSMLKRVENAMKELDKASKILRKAETPTQYQDAIEQMDKAQARANEVLETYYGATQKKVIAAKSEVFTETQKNDVIKVIDLQYQSSLSYADEDQLEKDMLDAATKTINGPMTTTGPDVQSSQIVNDALQEAAKDWSKETGDEIVSWTFIAVDDDVTTDLCRELDGRTFAESDPDLAKYTPPLHFNCRSFMQVNTASMKDNPAIDTGSPQLSKAAQAQIQFAEVPSKVE